MKDASFYEELINNSLSLSLVTDRDYNCVYASNTCEKLFGYLQEQFTHMPINVLLFSEFQKDILDEMRDNALEKWGKSIEGIPGNGSGVVLSVKTISGLPIDVYFRCQAISDGNYLLWSGIDQAFRTDLEDTLADRLEIAQQKITELKEHDFKLRFALECAESINWELSADFTKIIFSENVYTLYGVDQASYGYTFDGLLENVLKPYKEYILERFDMYIRGETDIATMDISLIDDKGEEQWLHVRGKFINEERKLIYGISVRVTDRKRLEQRLAQMAYVDSQTGLYRINYISDVMEGRIEGIKLSNPGLVMLDIYRFRDINAVFGYERGTEVLVHAAKRLSELTDQLIAKIDAGGFIILVNKVVKVSELDELAQRVFKAFEKPLEIEGQSYFIGFKIGIALAKNGKADFETLMKDAELALNHIKNDKVNSICITNNALRKSGDDHLRMVFEFRKAIRNNEFLLHFQPVINGETKKVSGAEALIRWVHPKRGMVSPSVFIPVAERIGMINQIGNFVLREAVRELGKCMEIDEKFYISVNVSVIQLMSSDFIGYVQDLIEEYDFPPANLVIEITESVFITDMAYIIDMLNKLRELGVRVSLDDFGTGYSSLNYLKEIPLDNLKIDQSFLWGVSQNPASEAILKTIISLARNLNLSITAEGVETAEHVELLNVHGGCDYLQGYYFSRPIPSDKLMSFLEKNRKK